MIKDICSIAQKIPEFRSIVSGPEFSVKKLPCATQIMAAPKPINAEAP